MRSAIKIIFLIATLMMTQTAMAQIVEFTCPETNTLKFTEINQDTFEVTGLVSIIKGSTIPFSLFGSAQTNSAATFLGAEYIKNLQQRVFGFVCNYANNSQSIKFSLQNHPMFGLDYCYFPNTLGNRCEGAYRYCALRCEFL